VGTLWDCHAAMERVLEARGGLNSILVIKTGRSLPLLFAEELYDFYSLNCQQILSVQTTLIFLMSYQGTIMCESSVLRS